MSWAHGSGLCGSGHVPCVIAPYIGVINNVRNEHTRPCGYRLHALVSSRTTQSCIEETQMFTDVASLERETLAVELPPAAHDSFQDADPTPPTDLYMHNTGRITADRPEWDGLWNV